MNLFGQEYYKQFKEEILSLKKQWKQKPFYTDLIKNPRRLLKYNSKLEAFLEKQFDKGYVLILAPYNLQNGFLINELKKQKKPFLYINWDEFIRDGAISYNSKKRRYELRYKKSTYNLKKVKSVFWDYNDLQEVFHFKRSKFNFKEQLFIARWLEALKTLEFILDKSKWFPAKPFAMKMESQNKFGELMLAKKLGLRIPSMIFTNDSREAQKFLFDHTCVLKESGLKMFYGNQATKMIETRKINPLDKKLSRVNLSPCMFQEFIDKKFDVRAYIIDNKVVSIRIETEHDMAKIDWRRREYDTSFYTHKLPRRIEQKLIRFQKKLSFSFSSFDLAVDQKGDYYFLEMNRPGQWFFIEALSGVPIAKTLVHKL